MNKPMTASECLRQAKSLINTPEKWTKGWYWKGSDGDDISRLEVAKHSAAKMCSLGALYVADGPAEGHAISILESVTGHLIAAFNDSHTHAEVMAKFDEAIALAEKEERGE